jgi:hypothetical protein
MANLVTGFPRTWQLIKASTRVLNADGELLVLPILSGAATLLVGGALVWQAMGTDTFQGLGGGDVLIPTPGFYVWLFGFYIVTYFVVIFFNTALVGAAIERLHGGDPTIRSALGLAGRRVLPILGYAIISATVGMILRAIGERGGIVGRLLAGAIGLAWTVATFLVVPVLAAEGVGPMEAVERSGALLRRTWGENLIGNSGIGLVTGIVAGLAMFAGFGGWMLFDAGNVSAIVIIGAAAFVGVAALAFGAALTGVYTAAVYYYAVIGEPPEGFDRNLVRDAFERKPSAEN